MNVTIFGAGAMGTLYGARLAARGHAVSVLARGARRAAIDERGLRVRPRGTREAASYPVVTIASLDGHATDLVLVLVRAQQLGAVLPLLAKHDGDVALMVNVARGYDAWRAALGDRFFVAFPGATGHFVEGDVVEYEIVPGVAQPTVIGEPSGPPKDRSRALAAALRDAGFPTSLRSDMEAWQRTHAAWITPFMLAASIAERDPAGGVSRALLALWVDAMREGLAALRAEGVEPTPASIRMLAAAPRALVTGSVAAVLGASRSLREHLVAAGVDSREEGIALAREIADRAAEIGASTPRLSALVAEVEPETGRPEAARGGRA